TCRALVPERGRPLTIPNPTPDRAPEDWQRWQVTITEPWQRPVEQAPDPIRWGTEIVVAGFVTAYSAVLGGLVGVIWPHVAPRVRLVPAINGSEAASKALLGDDMWLALLG